MQDDLPASSRGHPDREGKERAFGSFAAGSSAGIHTFILIMTAEKTAIQRADCPKRNGASEVLLHLLETLPAGIGSQPLNRSPGFFLSSAKLCRLFPNFRFRDA